MAVCEPSGLSKASELTSDDDDNEQSTEDVVGTGIKNEEKEQSSSGQSTDHHDAYAYTKREFTSEIFKIEIQNLPSRYGFANLKKLLLKLNLKPNKIKGFPKGTYAFVTFRCEEDRHSAINAINGYQWKGKTLKTKLAKPRADPLVQKRKQDLGIADSNADSDSKRLCPNDATEDDNDTDIPVYERIMNAVTPLWKVPYEDQLKSKHSEMVQVIKTLGNHIKKLRPSTVMLHRAPGDNNLCCELLYTKPSPVQEEYRNKCEFTIGKHPTTKAPTVGFRLGRYKGGGCEVVEPSHCKNVPQGMKDLTQALQNFIQTSSYGVFMPEINAGHWRMLVARTTSDAQVMSVVFFDPQHLSQEQIVAEKQRLGDYFLSGDGKQCRITSMYFHVQSARAPHSDTSGLTLLFGDEYITEHLLDMKFRISPDAFFQVNTKAAEVLYDTIGDWCEVTENTTVLDVCCGTGTIGISLLKKRGAKKCIAIEMNQQATQDAKHNAEMNGVMDRLEIHCAKAEDVVSQLMHKIPTDSDCVAVLDPPRAGLHSKVVQALRRNEFIKRLVFVACNPRSAMPNFIDLMRPISNRVKGRPFEPVKAVPVDLFPQTSHCELVLLFKR